ncbi:MAG: dTDP-4-dehydrorhamnose reductase [Acidobacteria bacterium]|nr:dTDP-4-dehydrorhamnose reductase [Acidobacteriota bacterium]
MSAALVFGAAGQLGAVMVDRLAADGHEVVAVTRREIDVTDHDAVTAAVAGRRPSLVVNCTAFNDVDGAESQPAVALDVNAFAVRSMARAAAAVDATFVHYSTDFVFDGRATEPYRESDRPSPESVYASSKLLGEWFAADAPRHYVLRVASLFGGPAARSSIDRIVDALVAGREARVFVDRVVSPSYVDDVAAATLALVSREAPHGLYHCVNSGVTTWAELGQAVARLLGVDGALLAPVKVDDVIMKARRPKYAALSNARLRDAGVDMPGWEDAIARHLLKRRESGGAARR